MQESEGFSGQELDGFSVQELEGFSGQELDGFSEQELDGFSGQGEGGDMLGYLRGCLECSFSQACPNPTRPPIMSSQLGAPWFHFRHPVFCNGVTTAATGSWGSLDLFSRVAVVSCNGSFSRATGRQDC